MIWKEFNVINSYTCESSFCGASSGEYSGVHFDPKIYAELGAKFCETLLDMINPKKFEEAKLILDKMYPKITVPIQEKPQNECDSADDDNNDDPAAEALNRNA